MVDTEAFHTLLSRIRVDNVPFYRERWGTKEVFAELPQITRQDFISTPLSKRRYKNEKGLVKIVHDPAGAFLSEWSFADVREESYGLTSRRPMVYLSDPHEAIEKSMWCYENNMLPLIGEKDPDIAMFAAEKYQIDSLITDTAALTKLLPYLQKRAEILESISILGDVFPIETLLPYQAYARKVRLVQTLPETGAFGEAPLELSLRFHPLTGCKVEVDAGVLVVTKLRSLVTPVIKYRTAILAEV